MAQAHDRRDRGDRRRSRRAARTNAEALLAPLPEYGTLPPPAPWRQEPCAEPVRDDTSGPGGGGSGHRRSPTARPLGATAVPGLVPDSFVRPLPARPARPTRPAAGDVLARLAPPPGLDPLPRLDAPAPFGADQLLDPLADVRLRSVTAVAGVLAGAVTLPPALGLSVSTAAIDPVPNPAAAVALPAGAEAYAPYLGQVSCDPHAKPGVQAFAELVLTHWAQGRSAGITRKCSVGGLSEHKEGRAWDWALDPDDYADQVAGQRVVDWLLADQGLNARRLGIMYIIWNERLWGAYQNGDGWRPYNGPNDHNDHIHVSFSWAGAMQRTSWWTGQIAPLEFGPCRKFIGEAVPVYGDTINVDPCPDPKKKPKKKDEDKKDEDKKDEKGKSEDKDDKDKDTETESAPKKPTFTTVTVKPGDTLEGIARRNDTTVATIVKLNKLRDPDRIFVGQKLRVPAAGSAKAGSSGEGSRTKAPGFTVVTVQPGDTLEGLARRHGSTVDAIVKANSLADPDRIYPGQQLKIPN